MSIMKRARNMVAVLGLLTIVWDPGLAVEGKLQSPAEAYTIISLGTLGGNNSEAYDISENGIIGGSSLPNLPGGVHAFVYQNGAMQTLGFDGDVWGVNAGGHAVGRRWLSGGFLAAFRFDGQQVVYLGTLGGSSSEAYAINSAGDIVGGAQTSDNDFHAFLHQNGSMTDLGTLGGTFSYAYDINDSGTVVGESTVSGTESRTFMWQNGTMTAIQPPGSTRSHGFAINNAGQIAIGTDGATSQGFLYSNGVFTEISSLGGTSAQPLGMNDWGHVVGISTTAGDVAQHAFIFKAGTTTDLNDLLPANSGWVLREAWDINNAGAIVGVGFLNGDLRAFLMTPAGTTQSGDDVEVTTTVDLPGGGTADVSLTFASVDQGGQTVITASHTGPPVPSGFQIPENGLYYEVQTTATFSGPVTLCFSWPEGALQNEANAKLLHYENGAWMDVTTWVNTTTNVVCGQVTSLSPFVIAELAYEFLGFAPPLLPDGSASIQQTNAGRSIPVKFQLRFAGQLTGAATATIAVYRVLNVATGTVDTTDFTEDAGAANENGDRFRYDSGGQQYVYNLKTKGWPAPATYRLAVTLSDGTVHSVNVSLR